MLDTATGVKFVAAQEDSIENSEFVACAFVNLRIKAKFQE